MMNLPLEEYAPYRMMALFVLFVFSSGIWVCEDDLERLDIVTDTLEKNTVKAQEMDINNLEFVKMLNKGKIDIFSFV